MDTQGPGLLFFSFLSELLKISFEFVSSSLLKVMSNVWEANNAVWAFGEVKQEKC